MFDSELKSPLNHICERKNSIDKRKGQRLRSREYGT